jgi:hypothetical protein
MLNEEFIKSLKYQGLKFLVFFKPRENIRKILTTKILYFQINIYLSFLYLINFFIKRTINKP